MLIAHLEPPHAERSGDWFYRTYSPGRALAARDGLHVVCLTNAHRCRETVLDRADVLVVNMVCDADLLPVFAARRRRGQLTIYEVNDDVNFIQPWSPLARFFGNAHNQLLFRLLVHAADAVQFSTPELQRRYGRFNERQAVFPNQIARPAPGRARDGDAAHFTVGWGGSFGHLEDVERVAPALIEWLGRRPEARLHLMGDRTIWALFDAVAPKRKRYFPPGSIDDYYAFLATLDAGIAPLDDTGFNRCRSDVKFLEYALAGVVPVLQALTPYEDTVQPGRTGFLFRDAGDLVDTLDRLAGDRRLCQQVSDAARSYVQDERSEAAHAERRLRFYRMLGAPGATAAAPAGAGEQTFQQLARLEGARAEGRHLTLDVTRYEQLLLEGILRQQRDAQAKSAFAAFSAAAELEPRSYQPDLYMALACGSAGEKLPHLERALAKNPESLWALLEIGDEHGRRGEVEPALRAYLTAAKIAPTYNVTYGKAAALLEARGDPRAKHFEDLMARFQQPFFDSDLAGTLGAALRK